MLREINSVAARRSTDSCQEPGTAMNATCLLCRLLWPIVVQHRHLLFDDVRKQRRPFVRRCTPEDSQSAGRLVFHYSVEISIDESSSS
jgi:hypothetical protein